MKHILIVIPVTLMLLVPITARAHCDTLDGPVVITAKAALEKGDVTPVLKWVNKESEAEIRDAFKNTLAARKQGDAAKELADRYFFETLVRVHRAGEGAPYTGLQPAGTVEPAIAAADKALDTGKIDALAKEIAEGVVTGIRRRFDRVLEAKKHADDSVTAGREYVAAYVEYVHYVERLHAEAAGKPEAAGPTEHHHH